MKTTKYMSYYVGELPKGCLLCMRGAKLVYFATGLCSRSCFYCPLSLERKGKDVVYADETPVRGLEDVIKEAKLIRALGVGVTGGDPLLKVDRVVETIRALREVFGRGFHVHVYTTTQPYVNSSTLKALGEAGVDELRLHPKLDVHDELRQVEEAVDLGLNVGLELPAIPGFEAKLMEAIERACRLGASFVTINELEMTESNAALMQMLGFRLKKGSPSAVEGSWEVAMALLKLCEDLGLNAHFCPAYIKDSVQFRNRLRRKAKSIALPHEVITRDPLLVKGVVEPPPGRSLHDAYNYLRSLLPQEFIYVNEYRNRVECRHKALLRVAQKLKRMGFKLSIVGEMPTSFREQVLVKLV